MPDVELRPGRDGGDVLYVNLGGVNEELSVEEAFDHIDELMYYLSETEQLDETQAREEIGMSAIHFNKAKEEFLEEN